MVKNIWLGTVIGLKWGPPTDDNRNVEVCFSFICCSVVG